MTESMHDERFLFELADRLRTCPESSRALYEVACSLGEYFGASRCLFVEIDDAAGLAIVSRDYTRDLASVAGSRPLSSYSAEMVTESRAGRTLVNDDASVDPRTASRYELAYRPVAIRAYVTVPLLRDSDWVSLLLVSTHEPRAWQPREVTLIQRVAERTWLWFEHLVALEALRESEARKAAILDSALDAIVTIDHLDTILEINRAAETAFGHRREAVVGRRMSELLIPASHRAGFRLALESCFELCDPQTSRPTELPVICADGSERPAEIAISRVAHHAPPLFTAHIRDVSERNRAAGAIRASEQRFRLLVEAVRDYAIVLLDPTGAVTTWNAGAERLYGYRTDEIVGQHFSVFYAPGDVDLGRPKAELEAALRYGSYEDESWRLRKDGTRLWANVVISALRGTDGELVGFGKVIRDMTERVRANEQFRLAIEATPTGMIMVDCNGRIALVNSQLERLFGYTRQELLGASVDILVPVRFRAHHGLFRAMFQINPQTRLMGAGRDLYGLRKDGSEVPIEIGLNPFRTPEGDFVLSSIVDITERKRAMDQLRLAIEAAPTGMIMIDSAGKIVLINAQVEKLFGYKRDELVGQAIELLVPEQFRQQHPQFRNGFVRDPQFRAMGAGRELHGMRKDGTEVPIEIGLNPLHSDRGDFVLSSVVDITERKRTEHERELLLAQLGTLNAELEDRVQRRTAQLTATLAEREVLLQEVHHRVKNNLQVISSLINMQLRTLDTGASRTGLQECRTRVDAIALIHEQLYQSGDYARVPFSEYARRLAINILHATGVSPEKITLGIDLESMALPVDKAIPCGLILNELMTNALKHAFPGERSGAVRVQLRRDDGGRVVLAVADDGIGMMRDLEPSRSTTLGLQLVTTLVEQLDGRLDIERRGGTTFRITFPLDQDGAPPVMPLGPLGPGLS